VTHTFYTIGHSTHSIEAFANLLLVAEVSYLVDVRTVPRSRTNPQFNKDAMPEQLGFYQIGYEHMAELGGLRGKQKAQPNSPNGYWENRSFRNYADYALSPEFTAGLEHLVALGRNQSTAIMCAEAVWWRCHRRIIADYLLVGGQHVVHILSASNMAAATMTPAARRTPDNRIVYPPEETV
jgi:uncharacterized protein (DUF488 family)